ncbi:hypothetical protein [Fulvivirga sp.]|uniref:hypothetical protein n=1 Tax=Fulvivirga sp. TaxID=1931237 RepID=UPI0032EF5F93
MAIEIIKELLQRSDTSGSKSTILKPLTWFIVVIISGIILLQIYDSPNWIVVMFAVILVVAILIFFFAYIYCLFTDKDAIRSEKYSIQKMAIEKGIFGDSNSGVFTESHLSTSKKALKISDSEEDKL